MKSKRLARKEKRQRDLLIKRLLWGGLGLILTIALVFLLWTALKPAAGESVSAMANTNHVPEGTDPGPYNTNPPTSGPHYANDFDVGFYDETDLADLPAYPEGYLVHNLEHGYVIFWYNCALVDDQACNDLKVQIQSVMDRVNNFKVIAFPWESLEVPVVLTSWGQMQEFETFDHEQAQTFVERNRNQAPEPQAP